MSVSTTHRRPRQHSSMSTCRASCAERFGRNPELHGKKPASKTGSSTIFTAACTIRSRTAGIDSGLISSVPGLGISTRRAAIGRYLLSRSPLASSPGSRATPYSSTWARVVLSMPGAPLFRRTVTRACQRTSLRTILSASAWNLRPGSALAARYSACCKARTGSAGTLPANPEAAELAMTALTGPLLEDAAHRRSSGPSLTAGCVVLRLSRYYGRLRRPPGQRSASRGHRLQDATLRRQNPQVTGPGRASPVPAATIGTFRAPYAGESLTAAHPGSSPLPRPSP